MAENIAAGLQNLRRYAITIKLNTGKEGIAYGRKYTGGSG